MRNECQPEFLKNAAHERKKKKFNHQNVENQGRYSQSVLRIS
jgi:hypothetical protein